MPPLDRNYKFIDRVHDVQLLVSKFSGDLTSRNLTPLLEDLVQVESTHPHGFNRFSDLSELTGVSLSIQDIHRFAAHRREQYRGPSVKSALYAKDPLHYGLMRIYAAVLCPSAIEAAVFYTIAEADEWLAVPSPLLRSLSTEVA